MCGVPECRYGLWDDALPSLQLGDVRARFYIRGACKEGMRMGLLFVLGRYLLGCGGR